MSDIDPFDSRPDPVLGARLRDYLAPADHAAFVARVRAGLPRAGSQWEILARWARPGIAASLIFAAAVGYWVAVRGTQGTVASGASEVAIGDRPTDSDGLMAIVLGAGR